MSLAATSVALSLPFTPLASRSMAAGAAMAIPLTVVNGTVPALTDAATEWLGMSTGG